MQADLFDYKPAPHFDGETYDPQRDHARLTGQIGRVFDCMKDGRWRSLDSIARITGDHSHASISARLRDLRKDKFGGHTVERKHIKAGLFHYRLIVKDVEQFA